MSVGEALVGVELLRGIVERLFQLRSHAARLHAAGAVLFIYFQHLVHVRAEYQGYALFLWYETPIDARSAAVDVERDLLLVAQADNLLYVLLVRAGGSPRR